MSLMKEQILEFLEPEEAVGNLWHDYASSLGAPVHYEDMEVELAQVRTSVQVVFRGLGGEAKVEISQAPATASTYRMPVKRKLGNAAETIFLSEFDGERLRLPPVLGVFPEAEMNRAHYIWLAAFAANCDVQEKPVDPLQADVQALALAKQAIERVWESVLVCKTFSFSPANFSYKPASAQVFLSGKLRLKPSCLSCLVGRER